MTTTQHGNWGSAQVIVSSYELTGRSQGLYSGRSPFSSATQSVSMAPLLLSVSPLPGSPLSSQRGKAGAHFRLMTLSAKPDKTPLFGVGSGSRTKVISGYVHLERKERRQQEHLLLQTSEIQRYINLLNIIIFSVKVGG